MTIPRRNRRTAGPKRHITSNLLIAAAAAVAVVIVVITHSTSGFTDLAALFAALAAACASRQRH